MGCKWTANRRFYIGIKKPGTFARPERMKFKLDNKTRITRV